MKICRICPNPVESRQPNASFCSVECRKNNEIKTWGRSSDKSIASGTVGAISEMMVGAFFMKKGYSTFRALSPACLCDLIIFKDGIFNRVEVRTGYKALNGKISFPNPERDKGKQDIFAVYIRVDDEVHLFNSLRQPITL